jgi:hypothetical protein
MQSSSGQRLVSGSTPVPIKEIHVLWITAGLGCDGDTIAMTAATQPSIEDILLGGIPWIPKVYMHNPFLTYDNGEEFMRHFHAAAEGKLAPFILVMEGSIPNEKNKSDGYWATFGTDQVSGQPILTCDWVDRLAPKAWAVVAAGTCATYGGIHAMEGNPTGCMDWRIILGGVGSLRREFRSFAFLGAQCSRTISWKSSCTCCTWQLGYEMGFVNGLFTHTSTWVPR